MLDLLFDESSFFVGSRLFHKSATTAFISITKSCGGLYGLSMICI